MRLLLDTHIWLWRVLEPERLSARMRGALLRPDIETWLSPISVQESHRVSLPHRDPADRFLVATARVLDLTLATANERLLAANAVPAPPESLNRHDLLVASCGNERGEPLIALLLQGPRAYCHCRGRPQGALKGHRAQRRRVRPEKATE